MAIQKLGVYTTLHGGVSLTAVAVCCVGEDTSRTERKSGEDLEAMSGKRKGLSAEQKRDVILEIYHSQVPIPSLLQPITSIISQLSERTI
jgi:hypothetical protein